MYSLSSLYFVLWASVLSIRRFHSTSFFTPHRRKGYQCIRRIPSVPLFHRQGVSVNDHGRDFIQTQLDIGHPNAANVNILRHKECIVTIYLWKKAARILLLAARTTLEHLNRRTVRFFVVFTVLSLLLCRLICILLIPRCEPAMIMHPCYQEHLAQ